MDEKLSETLANFTDKVCAIKMPSLYEDLVLNKLKFSLNEELKFINRITFNTLKLMNFWVKVVHAYLPN